MTKLSDHYGTKEGEFIKIGIEMEKDLMFSKLSDVIDRHFSECNAGTRMKIHAYACSYLSFKIKENAIQNFLNNANINKSLFMM